MGSCASCSHVSVSVHHHQVNLLTVESHTEVITARPAGQIQEARRTSSTSIATSITSTKVRLRTSGRSKLENNVQTMSSLKNLQLTASGPGVLPATFHFSKPYMGPEDAVGEEEEGGDDDESDSVLRDPLGRPLFLRSTLRVTEGARYARDEVSCRGMPTPGLPEATFACSVRLKKLVKMVMKDSISIDTVLENLEYTLAVLQAVKDAEARRLCEEDDTELPPALSDADDEGVGARSQCSSAVPNEVRDWLASTFTRSHSVMKVARETPRFRSVANVIRAGIMVERSMFRRASSAAYLDYPPEIKPLFKATFCDWKFDIFHVNELSDGRCLKFVGYELFQYYNLINKFKVEPNRLERFLDKMECGYSLHGNPYHNLIHGADVAHTCHLIMRETGLLRWLSDIEVFAVIFASLIHDYEHPGTTNNYQINTRSDLAILYNDRGVLENHHLSAAFRLMRDDEECSIVRNLRTEQFREFRSHVVDMVLNTDMSLHFVQLKNMKNMLAMPANLEKSKALSLMVHCADLGHPSKPWSLHYEWTMKLVSEFFRQGDWERERGLPISPLCDRQNTAVAQAQIGFIDFIVAPSFQVMGAMFDVIQSHLMVPTTFPVLQEGSTETRPMPIAPVSKPWEPFLLQNKEQWKRKVQEEEEEEEKTKVKVNGSDGRRLADIYSTCMTTPHQLTITVSARSRQLEEWVKRAKSGRKL